MPIIWREKRTIEGKQFDGLVVFKSVRLVTEEGEREARLIDDLLSREMAKAVEELNSLDLLELRGKPGVLKLWYEVGRRLSFVDEIHIEPEDDRKFIWRALYDHAAGLVPGSPKKRANERLLNSHFYYCYLVGKLPWRFVESGGNWTAWVEFLDSERIRNDQRIIGWLGEKEKNVPGSKQNWLRPLTREIRRRFSTVDTTVLTEEELYAELEGVFAQVY